LDLTPEQLDELNEFYWDTDLSTSELKEHFRLKKPVHHFVSPLPSEMACPNCAAILVYRSRSARDRDEKECHACEHKDRSIYACQCGYCSRIKAEENQKRREEAYRLAVESYEARREQVANSDRVRWAISKLTRRQKLFLRAFLQVVQESEHPTWQEICERAGVVTEHSYTAKLTQLGLLLEHPDGAILANPALTLDMLGIEDEVRKVSNALRFEVLQRDRHTCQYCGRQPPEVELEIDHIMPVARGGTDDFENLLTSCRECNSGKSAKLIERFTQGHTKEEWRELIREKRAARLREQRAEVETVIRYWAECRGVRTVSSYDAEAIYRFVEIYDPTWIKAAIRIATRQQRSNYAKYVAGILKNWAKMGPPDYVADPDKALESVLDQKKATDKQIDYIAGLLGKLGLTLEEAYHKNEYDELTQLDARNLINALTESLARDKE